MTSALHPLDETDLLPAVHDAGLRDSAPDAEFDALIRMASLVCGAPICLVSLDDADRRWFMANLSLTWVDATPLADCAHTIVGDDLVEVADATQDFRLADNSLVTGALGMRFYAGVPLRVGNGSRIGTLCVIDTKPRQLDDLQRDILRNLASAVGAALENWRFRRREQTNAGELTLERQRLSNLIDGIGVATCEWNVRTGALRLNQRWEKLIGQVPADMGVLRQWYHCDDVFHLDDAVTRRLAGRDREYCFEARVRHADGRWIWTENQGAVTVWTEDGAPEWVFGWVKDISARKEQQQALQASELLLAETGRAAGVGGWEIALAAGELKWTSEAFRIAGLEPGQRLSVEEGLQFYAPEAREALVAERERVTATGGSYDLEVPFVRADGRRIWVRSVGSAVFAGGKAVRLVGAFIDITSAVAQREALRSATERIQLAADAAGIGIFEWNIRANTMKWDGWMCRHYGFDSPDEGDTYNQWASRMHPADRPAAEHAVREAIAGRKPLDIEFRVLRADGATHTLKASAKILRDRAGVAVRMIGTNLDITPQRQLAAELSQQHELLRVTLQSIGDAVITTDAAGRVTWMNPVAERLTGWRPVEAVGTLFAETFCIIDAVTREPRANLVADCLIAGKVMMLPAETLLISRFGNEYAVEDSMSPIRNYQGEILGVIAVFRDVTTQRRMEVERGERERQLQSANGELDRLARHMAKARRIAEQANRAKTRFLAAMSHELRTPLNGILGYAQLLQLDGGLDATQCHRVESMLTAGTHLLGMISAVLDLSEIETEGTQMHISIVDLPALLEASLGIVRPTAESKCLTLRLALPPDLPQRVVTDPARLRQVLLNLLGNAVKYTSAGSVELRTSVSVDSARLRIEVADTGPGIPAEQQHRLFKEFERLETAASDIAEGAALGLSIAGRLANLLGGVVGHADNPGGGSIFWLDMPLAVHGEAEMLAADASDAAVANPSGVMAGPVGSRVLIVDDVPMNRDIAECFIRSAGYDVVTADGGAAAVEITAASDFLVVLMDVRMPEMDGLEATRRIRALPGPRGLVPIVALTAQVFTEQIDACREAGMDTHLAKPFTLETLLCAIQRGVATAHARTPSRATRRHEGAATAGPTPAFTGLGADLPVMDEAVLLSTSAMLKPAAVTSYLHTLEDRAEELRERLSGHDDLTTPAAHLLAEAAHALAGSAGMFGFERLIFVARNFERAVRVDPTQAIVLAPDLNAALELTVSALRGLTRRAAAA